MIGLVLDRSEYIKNRLVPHFKTDDRLPSDVGSDTLSTLAVDGKLDRESGNHPSASDINRPDRPAYL